MIPLQLATRWNVYGVAPNRRYIQANKNEGIHELFVMSVTTMKCQFCMLHAVGA